MNEFVFVGFNSRVAAVDRRTGDIVWEWKSPKGRHSFVALLLDGDQLFVSIHGYTYCLDARTGSEVWNNPFSGFGHGIPSLVSAGGANSVSAAASAAAAAQAEEEAAAASS